MLQALQAGAIDVYPEYLGTISAEILRTPSPGSLDEVNRGLAPLGLAAGVPLGFANSYAIAMTKAEAQRLGVRTLSDLASHAGLVVGLSHEFLGRADGWPGLAKAYGLGQRPVGIDHGISYEALATGRIAATDIYSTDAKIEQLGLVVLEDDRHYFPRYDAVLLYRADTPARTPVAWRAVQTLEGRIDQAAMIRMNGDAELRGRSFAQIADDFVAGRYAGVSATAAVGQSVASGVGERAGAGAGADSRAGSTPATSPTADRSASASLEPGKPSILSALPAKLFGDDLWRLTREHLVLVLVAVGAATLIGVPLGAAAAAWPKVEQPVMAVVGVLQTIPALALFAMLIPLLGRIGTAPALVALSLYALLPIVRNTTTGLAAVPRGLKQAGVALGLTPGQRWLGIDLPLAAPVILAGLKTAAVMSVGTATIAAFIGAGGFGERIATGLALNDHAALLAGAIPAAVLALVTQGCFELAERAMRRR